MPETRLTYLLQNYFEGKATAEENDELMSALMNADNGDEIKTVMDRVWEEHRAANPVFSAEKSKSVLAGILKIHSLSNYKNTKKKRWLFAAAAVILVIGSAIVYQLTAKRTTTKDNVVKTNIENKDIAPGGNRAVLTLADNSVVVLDNAANGALAQQGNTKILKLNDGQLAYTTREKPA
jgi:ferric-dicitrate binding protein FerR (iron transport regulator)